MGVPQERQVVLIETLWNVKLYVSPVDRLTLCINRNIVECKVAVLSGISRGRIVLIETLWNVKKELLRLMTQARSINRNIVECKAWLRR